MSLFVTRDFQGMYGPTARQQHEAWSMTPQLEPRLFSAPAQPLPAIVIMNNVALISVRSWSVLHALMKFAAPLMNGIQYKQLGDESHGITQSKFSLVFNMRYV